MSIQDISANFKRFLTDSDSLTAGLLIIVGISSFFLGRASVGEVETRVEQIQTTANTIESRAVPSEVQKEFTSAPQKTESDLNSAASPEGGYVASKSGTKYHLPWCGSAKQIKEENKIWFTTKAEAEAAGYTPASNCKGI